MLKFVHFLLNQIDHLISTPWHHVWLVNWHCNVAFYWSSLRGYLGVRLFRSGQPSIAPTICGIPCSSSNTSISSYNSCLVSGNLINWSFSWRRKSSNSAQILLAVDNPIPNCSPQLLKLSPVASLHSATAALFSTLTGERILVCCFWRSPRTRSHKALKVGRVTRKWTFQSVSMSRLAKSTLN